MSISDFFITVYSFFRHSSKRKFILKSLEFSKQNGIEIGGPSKIFSLKGHFPIYLFANSIDGVNFKNETVWEGSISEGMNYQFHRKKGFQYIREATNLLDIENNQYDFVLSCHSLEHVANPIKALKESNRILKTNGKFVLILPDKRFTFDKNRSYTTFEHLLNDELQNVDEKDTTHFEEVINTNLDAQNAEKRQFLINEMTNNYQNRYVHHHVFSFEVIKKLLEHTGFEVTHQQALSPFHLVTIAQKK